MGIEESKHETLPLSGAADSIYNGEQGGTSPTQARLKQQINVRKSNLTKISLQKTVTTEGAVGSQKMDEVLTGNAT